jgi:glycosyltransferase involved in cell wall biosynthesis
MATTPRSLPKLSIGLPVYNGEKFRSEVFDCFFAQTFKAFRIIICD